MAAAIDRCGLYPINVSRGMEHISGSNIEENQGTVRALLSATFGEKLEELRAVGDLEKKKRGKKMTTASGLSFTELLESDGSDAEFLMRVPKKSRRVELSEESDVVVDALMDGEGDGLSRSGEMDVESEVENFDKWLAEGGEGSSKPKGSSMVVGSSKVMGSSKAVGSSMKKSCKVVGSSKALRSSKQAEIFPVGIYVTAVYDDELYGPGGGQGAGVLHSPEVYGYIYGQSVHVGERQGNLENYRVLLTLPSLSRQGCGVCHRM